MKYLKFCFFLVFLTRAIHPLHAQTLVPKVAQPISVSKAKLLGTTLALRDLAPLNDDLQFGLPTKKKHAKEVPNHFGHNIAKNPHSLPVGGDALRRKSSTTSRQLNVIEEPDVNIDGMDSQDGAGVAPPDPSGEIGKNHFIEVVNAAGGAKFQIFDKTGVSVYGPAYMNTFWSPFGLGGLGDPVALYDQAAERWLLTEFADFNENKLLVAVSATSDPLGEWYAYQFQTPTFPDYPKYFIWHDAYYVTTNEYNEQETVPIYALDRSAMLNGAATASMQEFGIPRFNNVGFQIATGADWDGSTPPPAGAPAQILRMYDDSWDGGEDKLEIWSLHVDWLTPANSTLDGPLNLPTVPFESQVCNDWMDCLPQPNGGPTIDALEQLLMYRVQYRNFGTYEAMVCNHLVDVNGADLAGIRWYELRRTPTQNWYIYQQGTHSPDDLHRWMGSIAMDGRGNIALGYATMGQKNGTATFPSVRFTGRRASDPLNVMTLDEYEAAKGGKSNNINRFGDYSQMTVDPTDELKFWYVSEYIPSTTPTWATKIVAFGINRDTLDIGPTKLIAPVSSSTLTNSEVVKIELKNFGYAAQNQFAVSYSLNNGAPVTDIVNQPLLADSSYQHTFVPTIDLAQWGDYVLKIYTTLDIDQNKRNDTLKKIIRRLPELDASIKSVAGLGSIICAADNNNIKITIQNRGFQPLTSLKIRYRLNNDTLLTKDWVATGGQTLNTDQSKILPDIFLNNALPGNNTLLVYVEAPNAGGVDGRNSNDTLKINFTRDTTISQFTLKILTDSKPYETTWTIKDTDGNILHTGGPYPNASNLYTQKLCLDKSKCYVFTIFDSSSDGISQGSYSIRDDQGRTLVKLINKNFGASESNPFCAQYQCLLQATAATTAETSVGSADGSILMTSVGGVLTEYSINDGFSYQSSPLFSNLTAGNYTIKIKDGNGCKDTVNVTVQLITASQNITYGKVQISIAPNPTDGMFAIKVKGLAADIDWMKVAVFDAIGQQIRFDELTRFNDTLQSVISISNQPKGTYFVRIFDEKNTFLVKVIYQ